MSTLVLSPRFTDDGQILWRIAHELGWDVQRLASYRVQDPAPEEPVLYGEPIFVGAIAEQWGLWVVEPQPDWLPRLPDRYLRRWVRFSTLGSARKYRHRVFVKPAEDKCFGAGVYGSGDKLPKRDSLSESTPVLVSEAVSWDCEFRCFVLQRKVVAHSIYLREGALARNDEGVWACTPEEESSALALAAQLCEDEHASLPDAFVLDVGLIVGRGWAVVEANGVASSGIYGCDPVGVLQTLRGAVRRK